MPTPVCPSGRFRPLRLGSCLGGASLLLWGALGCSGGSAFSRPAQDRAQKSALKLDAARLRQHIVDLVAVRQTETPVKSPNWGKLPLRRTQAAAYIDGALRAQGYAPVHERDQDNDVATENIYADLPGSDRPDEYVLLTGHYDNWHLGADDNASAVAVLLEAARILRTLDRPPRRTVRIVAFDREEEGLTGSERYAIRHSADRVVGVLNMDCVAFASHAPDSQSAPPGLALRSVGDFLAILVNQPAEGLLSSVLRLSSTLPQPVDGLGLVAPGDGHNPAGSAFLRSDHAPFWRRGIPALFFTDTANYRNPHYHKDSDLPDTLDPDFFARSAALIIGATLALADEPS